MATVKATRTKTLGKETATTFVALPPMEQFVASECIVEREHPRGATMRVRLTGRQSPEVVAALGHVVLGAEP